MSNLCVKRLYEKIKKKTVFSLITLTFIIFYASKPIEQFLQQTITVNLLGENFSVNYCTHSNNLKENRKIKNEFSKFSKAWKFLHEMATTPSTIYNQCDMRWLQKDAIPWFNKYGRTDVETSYISIWEIQPAGQFSRVVLQTQYPNGSHKLFGGDFWRCFVRGKTSVPVATKDFLNGSYEFQFLLMESGNYTLSLSLEYTLCDGIKEPPSDWFIKGNVQGKEQKQGILLNDMPYINKPLWNGTTIKFMVPPPNQCIEEKRSFLQKQCNKRTSCKFLWHGYGSWINKTTWIPYCENLKVHYPRYKEGILWIFGDSVSSQFYHSIKKNRICKNIFRNCLYTYNWIYSLENYNLTINKYIRRNNSIEKTLWDNNDFQVSKVIDELKQVLYHPSMDEKSVLLLNYGLHYTEATNYTNFQNLIREIIKLGKTVRCKLVWRTSTSLNRHKYSMPNLHSRRFMTSQRILLYNAFATKEFCAAGYDILDVYPITDSYPEGTGSKMFPHDPVHYEQHVMKPVEQLLERVFGSKQ
ncbi:uncharacterized protein LOC100208485 [Hydra vulgaris]|uniref:uncharacterized protein LOC100208485 n=1 Tax=Hydra vulgaris TaxID=6087 RepID=UPI0032EA1768